MRNTINKLEEILRELSPYEKKGLDTSSLKLFIKSLKVFVKVLNQPDLFYEEISIDEKLVIIKKFLHDKKAFPTINDVIIFANERLGLDFRNQKASRDITIERIIGRIKTKPDLKDVLKEAVLSIRNEYVHRRANTRTKSDIITAETFIKWAEIIKEI